MNILILSSNNGGGHNSVAAALREAFVYGRNSGSGLGVF